MKGVRLAVLVLIFGTALLTCSCQTSVPAVASFIGAEDDLPEEPSPEPTSVRKLAHEIDCLEKHVEKYGSIVPQHADVWGQARLMMYRQEFERVMRPDAYKNFVPTIQANIATSDQAFLASAFSLEAAVQGAKPVSGTDLSSLVSGPEVISRTAPRANFIGPDGRLALEPTIIEDQKKRFLDHLHQLRRINEGDDNADAPGYALDLVRIPISVLTGACTETGYGAECTFTATPHLPDDLLPTTFRNLVVNDLVDLLSLLQTRLIENLSADELNTLLEAYRDEEQHPIGGANATDSPAPEQPTIRRTAYQNAPPMSPSGSGGQPGPELALPRPLSPPARPPAGTLRPQLLVPPIAEMKSRAEQAVSKISRPTQIGSPRPGKHQPLAPSQLIEVMRMPQLLEMAIVLRDEVAEHQDCHNRPYYLDIRTALTVELGAAYDLLSSERYRCLWDFCNAHLVEAIHTRNEAFLRSTALAFRAALGGIVRQIRTSDGQGKVEAPEPRVITQALAWAVIVESALLNELFLEDMRATCAAKGCPVVPPDGAPLFLPHPPPEVCRLFNDYVRCRWPLYVFAIDPETEDQNVGDSFSLRREEQLALALGFSNGQIGARSFTRYMRRIEQDIETIALNRTIIGFSHGDNTFGWRFYPRVQTPPIDSNFQALFRDLLVGGYSPGYFLRRRRLENGIRECVALVIMPCFVPYIDLEVTGNWFRLADPKCKALNLKQVMRLSRSVQRIRNDSQSACDQGRYRAGDVGLMMARLEQLSERLPLQHQLVSVPYENTHGGFKMLSTGVTVLGPELLGWYGAPGINPDGDTALFLVGDNFSVLNTRVIVGGRLLDPYCRYDCDFTPTPGQAMDCRCPSAPAGKTPAPVPPGATGAAPTGDMTSAVPPEPGRAGMKDEVVQSAWFQHNQSDAKRPAAAPAVTVLNSMPRVVDSGTTGAPTTKAMANAVRMDAAAAKSMAADAKKDVQAAQTAAAAGDKTTADQKLAAADKKSSDATTTANQAAAMAEAIDPVKDTRYQIPHFQVELLSRQVLRVIIPKGAYSKDGLVDIQVATPYGVSTPVQIPILCSQPPAAPSYGYAVKDGTRKITVYYQFKQDNQQFYKPVLVGLEHPLPLRITWDDPTGIALKRVQATFAFPGSANAKPLTVKLSPLEENGGVYEISPEQIKSIAEKLLQSLDGYSPANKLPASIRTTAIKLTPLSPPYRDPMKPPTHAVKEVNVRQAVQFDFVYVEGKPTQENKPTPPVP